MSARIIPCHPFDLGWEDFALPSREPCDNFALTPAQARARTDLSLARFAGVSPRLIRFVPGETLYWSVLVVNDQPESRTFTLSLDMPNAGGQLWYQHPWYTLGRAILPEARRYLVPELLLKHNRITSARDLMVPIPGLPDHAASDAPLVLDVPGGGFVKLLIKVPAAPNRPIRGRLLAGATSLFTFEADPIPVPSPSTRNVWHGFYYGLIPNSDFPRHRVSDETFDQDLVYLSELGVNSLIIGTEILNPAQFERLAKHGIRRLVLRAESPDRVRDLLAEGERHGIEVFFYTQDEPHASRETVKKHLSKARRIRAGGGKTFTAISAALDQKAYIRDTLDMPNVAVWSLPAMEKVGKPRHRGVYYWQCSFERPIINRYLAGIFCHMTGSPGFMPFVFRDGFDQARPESVFESDISPLYENFRQHMLGYPSSTGPIRTIQGEAFRQGLNDWLVFAAVREHAPEGFAILLRQLAPTWRETMTTGVLQDMYNGRTRPLLQPGPVTMAWLDQTRRRALDLLVHARSRQTRFDPVPADPAEVAVLFDLRHGRLKVLPAGMTLIDFPLCLIEGFPPDADPDAIGKALFGQDPNQVKSWTLRTDS